MFKKSFYYTSLLAIFSFSSELAIASDNKTLALNELAPNKTPTLDFSRQPLNNILSQGNFSKQASTVVLSDNGNYRVSLYSQVHPVPLYRIHSWVVRVETVDGKTVDNASIYIHGGMPAHRHGLPSRPRVSHYLGNGQYLIEGIKFSMIGLWELRINIKQPGMRDRAVFELTLPQKS